jgi:hypothetical protein
MIQARNLTRSVAALAVMLALALPALADHATKGKIKTISADGNSFTMTDLNSKDWTFYLAEGAKILRPEARDANRDTDRNRQGRQEQQENQAQQQQQQQNQQQRDAARTPQKARLNDLRPGTEVSLLYDKQGDRMMASVILVHEGKYQNVGLAHGKFKSGAFENNQIVLTDSKNKETTYTLDKGATVKVNDQTIKANDLKAGDEVVFLYEKSGTDSYIIKEICVERK